MLYTLLTDFTTVIKQVCALEQVCALLRLALGVGGKPRQA